MIANWADLDREAATLDSDGQYEACNKHIRETSPHYIVMYRSYAATEDIAADVVSVY